jgi:hypothetical protein
MMVVHFFALIDRSKPGTTDYAGFNELRTGSRSTRLARPETCPERVRKPTAVPGCRYLRVATRTIHTDPPISPLTQISPALIELSRAFWRATDIKSTRSRDDRALQLFKQ